MGLEDIRFIDSKNIIVTIPECNVNGNPSIFKANLDNNVVTNFKICKPNNIEKNWMPYKDISKDIFKVIYSLNPFYIKSIDNDDCEEIVLSQKLKDILKNYHGSSNGIDYNYNERLFIIHCNMNRTIHRFVLFNLNDKSIKLSNEFVFFNNSYIEFTCSLSKYITKNGDIRIFISIGVNDDKAFIIETTLDNINNLF
jgi:hypothetical protein